VEDMTNFAVFFGSQCRIYPVRCCIDFTWIAPICASPKRCCMAQLIFIHRKQGLPRIYGKQVELCTYAVYLVHFGLQYRVVFFIALW